MKTSVMTRDAVAILICLLIVADCTHLVRRYGYTIDPNATRDECDLKFVENAVLDSAQYELVGTVKLKDTGFSTRCNEHDALEILRREACTKGADVVNVVDEERPSMSSTCYRVKAQLLKHRDTTIDRGAETIGTYEYLVDSSSVNKRVSEDNKRILTIRIITYGISLIIATFLVTRILSL